MKQANSFWTYEALQLNPNADAETIDRGYRILAKRYHKVRNDCHCTPCPFRSQTAADYDATYEAHRGAVLKIIDEAAGPNAFAADQRIFETILSLLYIARRRDTNGGGMGIVQLERQVNCAAEHLEFHIWYLIEKRFIQRLENGLLSITAHGVDSVIAQDKLSLRRDRLIADRSVPERETADSREVEIGTHLTVADGGQGYRLEARRNFLYLLSTPSCLITVYGTPHFHRSR